MELLRREGRAIEVVWHQGQPVTSLLGPLESSPRVFVNLTPYFPQDVLLLFPAVVS